MLLNYSQPRWTTEQALERVTLTDNRWAIHRTDLSLLRDGLESWALRNDIQHISGDIAEHHISLEYELGKLALIVYGLDYQTKIPQLEIQRMVTCDHAQGRGLMSLLQSHLFDWHDTSMVKYAGVDSDGDGLRFIRGLVEKGMLSSFEMHKAGPSYDVVGIVTNQTNG